MLRSGVAHAATTTTFSAAGGQNEMNESVAEEEHWSLRKRRRLWGKIKKNALQVLN